MADINSYALNLDFNLQTTAPQTLVSISDELTQIESQLKGISSLMSNELTATANSLEASISGAFAGIKEFNSEFDAMPVDNAIEIKDNFDEITEIQEQLNDNLIESLDLMKDINKETKSTEKSFGKLNVGVIATALGFLGLGKAVKEAWKQEEQFERVGSRLHGTHQEITNTIREATFQSKMFTDAGIESYIALAGTVKFSAEETANLVKQNKHLHKGLDDLALKNKVMREEMTKYAVAAVQFNTITGISISTISNFMGQLKFYGLTLADTEMHMSKLTGAFKQAGTSAENMQKILDNMNETRPDVFDAWGEAGVEAQQTLTASAALMAAQLGMSEVELAKQHTDMLTNIFHMRQIERIQKDLMGNQLNMIKKITSAEALHMAQQTHRASALDDLRIRYDSATDSITRMKVAGIFRDKFSMTVKQAKQEIVLLNKEINAGLDGHRKTQKELYEAGRITREYEEAIGSAGVKWRLTMDKMEKVVQTLITKLTPAIELGIEVIDVMVTFLGHLLGAFTETQKKTEGMTDVVEDATSAWDKLVDNLSGANLSLKNIAISVGSVVTAVWLAARAWRFISKTIKPADIIKLSAIAASAFAIGAGMLMMATSFVIIAALGDKVIVPLMVLAAVLGGVMLAVMALSFAGPMGIAVMLALSVLMLALGASSIMLATAMVIAAFAFEKFIEAAQPVIKDATFAVNFLALAGSIFAGSLLLLLAAPLLLVASGILALGMMGLSAALWWIDEEQLGSIANSFGTLADSIIALSSTAASTGQLTAALAVLVVAIDKVINELEDSADRIYAVANKLYFASYMLPMASNAFARAVIDMVNEISRISIDSRNLNNIAYSYYDLAEAIDWGLDAIESRSRRSKALFGDIISDFAGMSLAIDKINTDMRTKLGADEVVKQRFEANTAKDAEAKSNRDNKVGSQPIHETIVRDTHTDKLRKQRQEELRAKAVLNKMTEQSEFMEETAKNTELIKDLKFAIDKQTKNTGTSRGSIGSSHVTTWI